MSKESFFLDFSFLLDQILQSSNLGKKKKRNNLDYFIK